MMAVALRSPRQIAREMLIACATLLVQECGLPKHPTPDVIFF